jgi:hypothetical protein
MSCAAHDHDTRLLPASTDHPPAAHRRKMSIKKKSVLYQENVGALQKTESMFENRTNACFKKRESSPCQRKKNKLIDY